MAPLPPLSEEPLTEDSQNNLSKRSLSFRNWFRNQLSPLFQKKSHLKILLSVIGCPLSPVSTNSMLSHTVSSEAEYIIRQFRATTGCGKMEGEGKKKKKSMYASGRVKVVIVQDDNKPTQYHKGCFVVWQMLPDMWLLELAVSGHQIIAGSNGTVVWRRTPWLHAHTAKGEVRPLRRLLQGLDPATIAAVFSPARHVGEKQIGNEECFVLKLDIDPLLLSDRSDSTAEIIRHAMIGYFSQRSGLLVQLEDSQLTRIQYPGAEVMYWETTISSSIEDYRDIDGVMIAHSGRSVVNLVRFGFGVQESTQMEEIWEIDDVLFNVPGLSNECFIPPQEVRHGHEDI